MEAVLTGLFQNETAAKTGEQHPTTGAGPYRSSQDWPFQKETAAKASPRQHPTTEAVPT